MVSDLVDANIEPLLRSNASGASRVSGGTRGLVDCRLCETTRSVCQVLVSCVMFLKRIKLELI